MEKKKTAYAIVRESSSDMTVQNQRENIEIHAKEMGYNIIQFFGENVSGDIKKNDYRDPDFINKLRTAIKEKKPDAIFSFSIDRWTRTTVMQGAYVYEFSLKPKIPIYFVKTSQWTIDPDSGVVNDKFVQEISSDLTPQKERENIVERTRPMREKRAAEGWYIGHLSDGYCVEEKWGTYEDGKRRKIKEIKVDDERKGIIVDIFTYFINGRSTDEIANILNSKDIPTTNKYRATHHEKFGHKQFYIVNGNKRDRCKAKWNGSLIAKILSNEWYIGKRTYARGKNNVCYLTHEAIITKEKWEQVQAIKKERSLTFRNKRESKTHLYLLSGLIFCGKCGRKLYGHTTGLNNHYYCSSTEDGEKCGARGVCKENIEAIITTLVKSIAINETLNDRKNAFVDFFHIDKQEEQLIQETIKDNRKLIEDYEQRLKEIEYSCQILIEEKISYKDKPVLASACEKELQKLNKEYEEKHVKINYLKASNTKSENRLKKNSTIDALLKRIEDTFELDLLRELFKATIEKIYVYNCDSNNTLLSISFTNDTCWDVIYSYRLLRNKFVMLSSMLSYNAEKNCLESKVGYPLFISANGMIHDKDLQSEIKEQSISSGIQEETLYQLILGDNYRFFEKEFSVDEYVRLIRNSTLPTYERLEELSDEAIIQNKKYKERRKKYNNGLPTCVPFVVKDADYEQICKEKKHLYNRKYKIKKHKKLSIEEKEKLLKEIDERLQLLSAQVKYLTREEALKAMKK